MTHKCETVKLKEIYDVKSLPEGNFLKDKNVKNIIRFFFTVSHIACNKSIFLAVCIPLYIRRGKNSVYYK